MKTYKFKVIFEDGEIYATAGTAYEAQILAQAERIMEGKNYTVMQTIKC
jgi:hypothetical protein